MTGGYGVEITKIEETLQKRILSVTIRESKPPADAMLTQALTQPFHIVKLKKLELPATFVFVCDGKSTINQDNQESLFALRPSNHSCVGFGG